jgi:hypothetical protein
MGDDELDLWESSHPVARTRKIDWLIVGLGFVRQVAGAAHEALCTAETLICAHANYLSEQSAFADDVRQQIETFTQED